MARKGQTSEVDASLDIESMIRGIDGAAVLAGSDILNTRNKVRSRIEILNCLLGGGRPYGAVTGSFGPPAGGKSTEAYESAAQFIIQEPDGVVIILDQESSADPSRLEYLGVKTNRVIRIKSDSINTGFDKLLTFFKTIDEKQKLANKRIPIFIVWDTITKGKGEDDETASRMDARNRARVIKSRMNDINPWLDKLDIILVLLNQVVLSSDMYGNVITGAGGGVGLKHDEHLRLYINKGKTVFDNLTGMAIQTFSSLTLDKTKLSPQVNNIPIVFNNIEGGRIDEEYSFLVFFEERKLLVSAGGWWHISPVIEGSVGRPYGEYLAGFSGNKRYDEWVNIIKQNKKFYIALRLFFMDMVGDKYALQRSVMANYYSGLLLEFNTLEAASV